MQEIILKENQSEHFDLITYPDGQHSIKLHLDKLNVKEPVIIICRIRNFSELEVLACLVSALNKYDFVLFEIQYIYLFGMRSDRAFQIGEPNYREVLTPILNSLSERKVVFFPHGKLWIDPFLNKNFMNFHLLNIYATNDFHKYLLIGADESSKKLFQRMDNFFIKKRYENKIEVHLNELLDIEFYNSVLIVDDLCDGGATFIAEAKYLKKHYPDISLNLFVAHGIFSKGFDELSEYFDHIYTTNSYQEIDHPRVTQIKVI